LKNVEIVCSVDKFNLKFTGSYNKKFTDSLSISLQYRYSMNMPTKSVSTPAGSNLG